MTQPTRTLIDMLTIWYIADSKFRTVPQDDLYRVAADLSAVVGGSGIDAATAVWNSLKDVV